MRVVATALGLVFWFGTIMWLLFALMIPLWILMALCGLWLI